MNRLWLARHAQTEWNIEGRMQGHLDSPLTDRGKKQAEALGRRLKGQPIQAIYTSTAGRALATAREVQAHHPGIPLISTEDLREIHLGPWEGLTKTEIRVHWPKEVDLFWHHPAEFHGIEGGEDYYSLYKRLNAWWEKFRAQAHGGEWLVISHGVTLQVLFLLLEGSDLENLHRENILHQCSLSCVEWENNQPPRFVSRNETSHLEGLID